MADARRASNNVYTVLAFIATLALIFGVIYVLVRYNAAFGGTPFTADTSGQSATMVAPAGPSTVV